MRVLSCLIKTENKTFLPVKQFLSGIFFLRRSLLIFYNKNSQETNRFYLKCKKSRLKKRKSETESHILFTVVA